MNPKDFRLTDLQASSDGLHQKVPYSLLRFITANPNISRSGLIKGLSQMVIMSPNDIGSLIGVILEELLSAGHVFETSDNRFAAFPCHAIQRRGDEWLVIGDTRFDVLLDEKHLFEVRSGVRPGGVQLERLVILHELEAQAMLGDLGIRVFTKDDLLELTPNVRDLAPPLVDWEGLKPSVFGRWEILDTDSYAWKPASISEGHTGLCRGVAVDSDGGILAVRHYWHHESGWSPMTSDEALIWSFKLEHEAGAPKRISYSGSTLRIPFRLPYGTYTALRYLAGKVTVQDGVITANDLDSSFASEIADRLALSLNLA